MLKETLSNNLHKSTASLFRFLVIDNGSTDRTSEYLLRLKQDYPDQLTMIRHNHLDFRSILLFAIAQVTTKWMVLLSDEDRLNLPVLSDILSEIDNRSDVDYVSGIARYQKFLPIRPRQTFESSRYISGTIFRTDFAQLVLRNYVEDFYKYEIFFLWPQYRIAIDAILRGTGWWPKRAPYHLNNNHLPSVIRASSGNDYTSLHERVLHALSFNEFCYEQTQGKHKNSHSKIAAKWNALINANKIYVYHSVRHEMGISRWLRTQTLFYMAERRLPRLLRSLIAWL